MVPRGYANGLITLDQNTVIQYFVDNPYSPDHERSIFYGSVAFFESLVSELTESPHISDKDREGIPFSGL
jgi:dTDP-4-dehydrorhamnose 3,5-epimerase